MQDHVGTGVLARSTDAKHRHNNSLVPFAIALSIFALHLLTNHNYGFHRDELQTLDDARYLAWGYVAYPPLTPFFGRLSLILFGNSVTGARFFPALTQSICIVLASLTARELGGRGHNTNPYGIRNEESIDHPDIFLCHHLRQSWPEFWQHFRRFG